MDSNLRLSSESILNMGANIGAQKRDIAYI